MKKINYTVKCNNENLQKNLHKDKNYIYKKLSKIVLKRREFICYENSGNKDVNIKNA